MSGAALSSVLAACGTDDSRTDAVPATVSLSQASAPALAAVASDLAFDVTGGRIPLSAIDSLIVSVTRVDVLPDSLLALCHPPVGDSLGGFHPGRPGDDSAGVGPHLPPPPGGLCGGGGRFGPLGPGFGPPGGGPDHPRPDGPRIHLDSILPPDSGWGARPNHWYGLTVVGTGRLDLVHLPTDSTNGLTLAAGSVPAGDYGAARLIVSDATIWFNTVITTDSTTLQPNTAYPVLLPGRPGSMMGIMTSAGFTIPSDGGNVVLIFSTSEAIGGAAVTHNGQVIIGPILRPRR